MILSFSFATVSPNPENKLVGKVVFFSQVRRHFMLGTCWPFQLRHPHKSVGAGVQEGPVQGAPLKSRKPQQRTQIWLCTAWEPRNFALMIRMKLQLCHHTCHQLEKMGTCKQPVNTPFLHNLPSLSITLQGPKNPISEFITVCQKQRMLQLGLPCRPLPGGEFLGPMCLESKEKTQRQWKKHKLDPNNYFVPTSLWNVLFFQASQKKTKRALHGVQVRRPLFLVRGISWVTGPPTKVGAHPQKESWSSTLEKKKEHHFFTFNAGPSDKLRSGLARTHSNLHIPGKIQ